MEPPPVADAPALVLSPDPIAIEFIPIALAPATVAPSEDPIAMAPWAEELGAAVEFIPPPIAIPSTAVT